MTADQIRSLQPELAALLETFRPYLGFASNVGHLLAYVCGLLADLKRKSIEPIALAAGAAVRTLQEFLSSLDWDHEAANDHLHRVVMDRHAGERPTSKFGLRGSAVAHNGVLFGATYVHGDQLPGRGGGRGFADLGESRPQQRGAGIQRPDQRRSPDLSGPDSTGGQPQSARPAAEGESGWDNWAAGRRSPTTRVDRRRPPQPGEQPPGTRRHRSTRAVSRDYPVHRASRPECSELLTV